MPAFLANFLDRAPGKCGELARLIDASLKESEPAISLPAAISFCAMIKSGRVQSITEINPNIYTFTVARSGSGKTTAQKCLDKILVKMGRTDLILPEPGSDSALLDDLSNNPRGLILWDEFGLALNELAKTNTGCRALILRTLMQIYSASNVFRGRSFATKERVDIIDPYLNLFCVSTPNGFFDSLTKDFIHSGFLPRWLIFFPEDSLITEKNRKPVNFIVTSELEKYFNEINDEWVNKSSANIDSVLDRGLVKKTLKFSSPSSMFYINDLDAKGSKKNKNDIEAIFYTRGAENFIKLCMVFSDYNVCDSDTADFCYELICYIIDKQIEQTNNNLGLSKRQKAKEEFYNLLQPGERLTHKKLMRRASDKKLDLNLLEKKNILQELVESGMFLIDRKYIGDSQKRTPFYYKNLKSIAQTESEPDEPELEEFD